MVKQVWDKHGEKPSIVKQVWDKSGEKCMVRQTWAWCNAGCVVYFRTPVWAQSDKMMWKAYGKTLDTASFENELT